MIHFESRPSLTVVGTWLSLVEHSLGVRGVGSSNLPVPTNSSASVINDLGGFCSFIECRTFRYICYNPRLRKTETTFSAQLGQSMTSSLSLSYGHSWFHLHGPTITRRGSVQNYRAWSQ